jgi:hypothetical protein
MRRRARNTGLLDGAHGLRRPVYPGRLLPTVAIARGETYRSCLTNHRSLAIQQKKQRGRPFPPGTSGNLRGRPQGSRNRATIALEELMEGDGATIVRKVLALAKKGNIVACKIILDRIVPPRRGRTIQFDAPLEIRSAADAIAATIGLVSALAAGKLTAEEASAASAVISNFAKLFEIVEVELHLSGGKLDEAAPGRRQG